MMNYRRYRLWLKYLIAIWSTTWAAVVSSKSRTDEYHAEALIKWLKKEKGYFNPALEMRRMDPNDPTSFFGMFANVDIKENDTLLRIPTSMIINSGLEEPTRDPMECATVYNLINEMKLGKNSKYAPYINYLQDTQPPGQLPSAWSQAGKDLLQTLLELGHGEDQILPPFEPFSWIEDDWSDSCDGDADPLSEYAALIVVSRAWDDLLIPVFDMMSHRNGDWLNTKSTPVHIKGGQTPVQVKASRDIKAGEQLYTTYNFCEDCEARKDTYGTPEILRDYGFVEQYPQSWIFTDPSIAFVIDEVVENPNSSTGRFKITKFISETPDEDDIDEFKEIVADLEEVMKQELNKRDPNIPDFEWNTIISYANAIMIAIKTLIASVDDKVDCKDNGTCSNRSIRNLVDLNENFHVVLDNDFGDYTCDINQNFRVFDDGTYEEIDVIQRPYHTITFTWNPEDRDTCMDLEDVVQICTSYRPHYHEYSVHYTARYLPDVKRVVWVGGGDSMLLHEFLKYPNLELAVGLELDQRVTRGSFKHFGTQPHFDNEKVEWWFGDATKSLLMLPKEYFGSFDMLIVDLSETVASFKVTKELDIFEALTLLLKPDGIFVKNEVYFDKIMSMFPYSMMIHWYDNPLICSQAMVLGSRTVDFINTKHTDHNVDGLLTQPFREIHDPYELIHDYSKNNVTTTKMCDSLKSESNGSLIKQHTSPGILMIVEAENTSADLTDLASLMDTLQNALEHAGFSVVSVVPNTAPGNDVIVSIIMKEGYVMARTMPEYKYCGFDIHLWSSFEKQVAAKKALLSAVGSKDQSPSSFRIIAGGMYGVSTWKEDKQQIGPHYDAVCKDTAATTESSTVNADDSEMMSQFVIDAVIVESVKMVSDKGVRVALLCGDDGMTCEGNRKAMLSNKGIKDVMTLSCPMMNDFNPYTSEAAQLMNACKKLLKNKIEESANKGKRFHAIVLDSSADEHVASLILNIFVRKSELAENFLKDRSIVLSSAANSKQWVGNFIKRFKHEVFGNEPAFYAEIDVMSGKSKVKLHLTVDGDKVFLSTLKKTLLQLENSYQLEFDVRNINGGVWNYQGDDFEPTEVFSPISYDQTRSLENWKSQKVLGQQTVLQLETKNQLSNDKLRVAFEKSILDFIPTISKPSNENSQIKDYTGLGSGYVLVATWSGGSIVVLWDGNHHVDLNIFTYTKSKKQTQDFESNFKSHTGLTTILLDEQPRGVGGIISYQSDLDEYLVPHWA